MYTFFFFQAEDGIRDYKVTGVQTCALPILMHYTLVQRLHLGPTCRARLEVAASPRRPFSRLQGQQVFHRAMHHRPTPSASSICRRRACARANCDLEKLTVLPICSAISSCV